MLWRNESRLGMRRLIGPTVIGSTAAITFGTGLIGPTGAWARGGCGPRNVSVAKDLPPRSGTTGLRLAMRLGTDPRCNVVYVIERQAGSGLVQATADLWDQNARGQWHRLQHALLFGPYSGARVRLISAHLGDINRDSRIEVTADFRVQSGSRAFLTYTFTAALAQTRPN